MIELLLSKGLSLLADVASKKGQQWLEDKTGVKLDSGLSAEQVMVLKKYEMDNQLELLKLAQQTLDSELADKQSARQREATVATSVDAPYLTKVIVPVLALLVVFGGGVMMYTSTEADVRTGASNLIMLVLGYYFGTSQSSHKKDELLRETVNATK